MITKTKIISSVASVIRCMVIAVCLTTAFPDALSAKGKIAVFSADWVMMTLDGNILSTSRLYVTPEAYRMDGMPMGGGPHGISGDITFLGLHRQNREYVFNHDRKLFFESEMDDMSTMEMLKIFDNVDSEVVLGRESVSGYPCIKKQVTTTTSIMGMKVSSSQTIWQSDRFDMPLRIQGEEGHISELRNIDIRKPSAKLFRPVTGYTRVDNLMVVLGLDFFDGQQEDDPAERRPRRQAQRYPAPKAAPEDAPTMDADDMMAAMEQFLHLADSDPEQMEALREMLASALGQASQIDPNTESASALWRVIPRRSGDRVGSERQTPDALTAVLGTQASLAQVCDYYENILASDGWQASGRHIQNNMGFLLLTRGDQQLTVSSADNPGLAGSFRSFYSLKLTGGISDPSRFGEVTSAAAASTTAGRETTGTMSEQMARGLLFPNSDFELGDLTNWNASGNAFDFQPTKGDNPTARRRGQPSNHQGDYWIGTYEKYQGAAGQQPGQIQGDRPTGTLTSIPFTVAGDAISFLIGGGNRLDSVYVGLMVAGREVLTATGNNHESMTRVIWDVSAYRGQEARIVIVDNSNRGWGHINADDFRYGTGG